MREDKNETRWDKLLHIRTMGRDDSHSDQHRFPYEPTPYCVLERLANAGYIRIGNTVIDYGCGKGRVDFFLSYQTRCHSIGVEYDERVFERALENKADSAASGRVDFVQANAETFEVPENVDRCYFFNPFSLELLKRVYYPTDEYISYMMTVNELMFVDEIDCRDLFPGNDPRERIAIFELQGEV